MDIQNKKFDFNQVLITSTLFLILFFFYIYNLDADPSIIKRYGDISDEGYWLHEARFKNLFPKNHSLDELKMSSFGAPLFNKATEIIYNFFGVSFFSSRLISIISLWLTVILVFNILKNKISYKKALIYSFLFGLTHEILIYGKLAMPLMLQNLFFVLSIYLFELKSKYSIKHFFVGASVGFAILSKISGYYFFFVFFFFYIYLVFKKKINYKLFSFYLIGCIFTLSPHLKMLVIDNLNEFRFMMSNMADGGLISDLIENGGVDNFFSKITINQLTFFLQISTFKSPGTIIILAGVLIFSYNNLIENYEEKSLQNLKKFCQIWIIVNVLLLVITNQIHIHHRTVGLFIPFFLYFIILIENKSFNQINHKINKLKKVIFLIIISIIISYYVSGMIGAAGRTYLNFDKYIFFLETSNKIRFLIILPIITLTNYILLLINTGKLKKMFLIVFFLNNLILNFILYYSPSYSIRDTSRTLTEKIKPLKPKYIYGVESYLYSLENSLIPIWNFDSELNSQIIKNSKKEGVIYVSKKKINSNSKLLFTGNIMYNKVINKYHKKIYFYYYK